jgi:Bacterial SH3 domain
MRETCEMRAVTLVPALCALLALSACHSPGRAASPPPSSTTVTTGPAATPGTVVQTSGVRTVLSPLGLNIRAQASKAAPIVRTAAQGATLTVFGHTDQGGGWFAVKGTTVTGWITDNPSLSAPGRFVSYTSSAHQFSTLYPDAWTFMEAPPASVVFRPRSGSDSVVVTAASTADLLGHGRGGYQQGYSALVVVCGVTGDLVTYSQVGGAPPTAPAPGGAQPERYLAQVRLTLDPQHALGFDANLAAISGLQAVRDLLSATSFPFPQCEK